MTEDEFEETQWTPAASSAYASMAESALTALADHVALVRGREGRQAELTAYFASGERLRVALDAFREAEFDLCGSFPFAKSGFDDDDEDDDEFEDEEDEEPGLGSISSTKASSRSSTVTGCSRPVVPRT